MRRFGRIGFHPVKMYLWPSTSQSTASRQISSHYLCIEVLQEQRPILYVARPDGDWCFLCGDEHPEDPSVYRVVGISHPISTDPTLVEVLDLGVDEKAERLAVGAPWSRTAG